MALRQMSLLRAETGTEVILDRSTHEQRGRGGDELKHAGPGYGFLGSLWADCGSQTAAVSLKSRTSTGEDTDANSQPSASKTLSLLKWRN